MTTSAGSAEDESAGARRADADVPRRRHARGYLNFSPRGLVTKLRPVSHFRRRETADARPHPIARAVTPRDAMTADDIVVNVRLLSDEEDAREHPNLTRFQRAKRSEVTGRTLRLRCSPGDTVAALKRRVEGASGRRAA